MNAYDKAAPRRSVNLSLNADMVERAKAIGLNMSQIAEDAIASTLAKAMAEKLRQEIEVGVAEHERYLEEHGLLSEAVWKMDTPAASQTRRNA